MNPRVDGPHLSPEDRTSPPRATGAGAAKRAPAPTLSEAALHKAVAKYLAYALPKDAVFTTIGHGGGGKVRGAQLKARGLLPGFPDILILWQGDAFCIELKSAKGRLSKEQEAVHDRLMVAGCFVETCRSIEEVDLQLFLWGMKPRARLTA